MKTQLLRDSAKEGLGGKYIATQAFVKKQERSQIHNLNFHLKELEKEQQRKSKSSRRRELMKIRSEINEIKGAQGREGKLNRKKSEGKANHDRLWTLVNKLRVTAGRGFGVWGNQVLGIKEGTVVMSTGCCTQLMNC